MLKLSPDFDYELTWTGKVPPHRVVRYVERQSTPDQFDEKMSLIDEEDLPDFQAISLMIISPLTGYYSPIRQKSTVEATTFSLERTDVQGMFEPENGIVDEKNFSIEPFKFTLELPGGFSFGRAFYRDGLIGINFIKKPDSTYDYTFLHNISNYK